MPIAQYHGKVYRSKLTGTHYTKTPNGNVLYKHPVKGPFVWTPSRVWTPEDIKFNTEIKWLVEVVDYA